MDGIPYSCLLHCLSTKAISISLSIVFEPPPAVASFVCVCVSVEKLVCNLSDSEIAECECVRLCKA